MRIHTTALSILRHRLQSAGGRVSSVIRFHPQTEHSKCTHLRNRRSSAPKVRYDYRDDKLITIAWSFGTNITTDISGQPFAIKLDSLQIGWHALRHRARRGLRLHKPGRTAQGPRRQARRWQARKWTQFARIDAMVEGSDALYDFAIEDDLTFEAIAELTTLHPDESIAVRYIGSEQVGKAEGRCSRCCNETTHFDYAAGLVRRG